MGNIILKKGKALKYYMNGIYLGCFWNFNTDAKITFIESAKNLIIESNGLYVSFYTDKYEVEEWAD